MNKTLIVACAVAGGLFAALAAPPPAQALPSVSLGIEKNADAVMHLARRGGGGRGMRGRSFGGGRGMRGRSFGGGRGMRGRSYGGGRASRGRAYGGRRGIRGRGAGTDIVAMANAAIVAGVFAAGVATATMVATMVAPARG